MREVKLRRHEIIDRIKANRDNHRAVFEDAFAVYKQRLEEALAAKLERVRTGKKVNHYISLPTPEDHTEDYDLVISMLEMSVDEEIKLTSQEFSQYMLDQWAWRDRWAASTSVYNSASAPRDEDEDD